MMMMCLLKAIDINSYCVIDYTAYRGLAGCVVIKELAIFIPQQGQYYSWVFEGELQRKTRSANEELKSEQDKGDVSYSHMYDIVNNAVKNYKFVVVTAGNGDEGVKFISEIIGRQVYDMELIDVDFDE